jgi:hypothetical protein
MTNVNPGFGFGLRKTGARHDPANSIDPVVWRISGAEARKNYARGSGPEAWYRSHRQHWDFDHNVTTDQANASSDSAWDSVATLRQVSARSCAP